MLKFIKSIQLNYTSKKFFFFFSYNIHRLLTKINYLVIFSCILIFLFYYLKNAYSSLSLTPDIIGYIICYITSFLLVICLLSIFKVKDSDKFSFNNIIYYFLLTIGLILICVFVIYSLVYFELLSTIYCDSDDESDSNKESVNIKNKDVDNTNSKDNTNYIYSGSIDKELANNIISKVSENISKTIDKIVPNVGAAAAGGTIGASMVKASKGMPPVQRMVAIGGSTFVGSMSAKLGIKTAESITKNVSEKTEIDQVLDKTPSPIDNTFINSPSEFTSPLEDLLLYQFCTTALISISVIIILLTI
jgi:hypothetical protein